MLELGMLTVKYLKRHFSKDPKIFFRNLSLILPNSVTDLLINEIKHLAQQQNEISILDLGAGSAEYWQKALERYPKIAFKLVLMDAVPIEVTRLNAQNVEVSRLNGLVPQDLEKVNDSSFDLVIAFDLIEHLSKNDGYILLYEIDRISSTTSIIFTPYGFVWQPPSFNNSFNAHISGWTPSELKKLGWKKLRGHTGFRCMYGPYGLPKNWVKGWVFLEVDALLKILGWKIPRASFAFSATKRVKNRRILEQKF
jgi:SAM-dependent methyltransferase